MNTAAREAYEQFQHFVVDAIIAGFLLEEARLDSAMIERLLSKRPFTDDAAFVRLRSPLGRHLHVEVRLRLTVTGFSLGLSAEEKPNLQYFVSQPITSWEQWREVYCSMLQELWRQMMNWSNVLTGTRQLIEMEAAGAQV